MDYKEKVQKLERRRQGVSGAVAMDSLTLESLEKAAAVKVEAFTKIAQPESVKYAIGAMQPVDAAYTKNSFAAGDRVAARLKEGLTLPVTFEYQGSVPLDVHVRGNSDIDLLVLRSDFVTVEAAIGHHYVDLDGKTPTQELAALRTQCATVLKQKFTAVEVDDSPGKAISLSGGTLARMVDVIPSHWHDTGEWRASRDTRHRDIYVFDSKTSERIKNRPFMHIGLIRDKCSTVAGSLRKVIRLLKNLKYDATPEIALSSYDIAALAYQMDAATLTVQFGVDLLLVSRALDHLQKTVSNEAYRSSLFVPDGSRKIFDKSEKVAALTRLRDELAALRADIYRELTGGLALRTPEQVLARAIHL